MNLLNLFEGREPHQQAIDKLEQARIDHLKEKMDYYAKHGMVEQFKKAKAEHDSYFKVQDECMGYGSVVGEQGIPGSVPTEKIPGKEDLLRGKGRSYYESVEEVNPSKKVFKDKAGKPVGEIGIDPESSPGNSEWYVYHYGTGYSVVGFDSAAEAKRELMYVHKHPEAVEGHESTFDEAGIPGNVPVEKIPGKEDLLKGKGRSYYEAQDQKKNSEEVDKLQTAAREFIELINDRTGPIYKAYYRSFPKGSALEAELRKRIAAKYGVAEKELANAEAGDRARRMFGNKLNEDQKLHVGDPIIVTAPNEFEGKTGEIAEFSPSGAFVVVNLYNHGEHSMHLSDVEFNQYAADQEDEDDWYDDGAEDTLEEEQKEFLYTVECDGYNKGNFVNKNDAIFSAQYMIYYGEKEYNKIEVIELKTGDVIWEWHGKKADNDVAPTEVEVGEGWSNKMVAQRTGQAPTPYSVYIKGKEWKSFADDDHAENVANKLRAKFKAEGKDPSVITIAPTDYDKDLKEFAPGGGYQEPPPPVLKKKDPFDDDDRSIYPRKIQQLLTSGAKVDSRVPGAMGHIIAANGEMIRMKPLNKPYSQKKYAWYIDQERDDKLLLKQVEPNHYVLYDRDWLPQGTTEAANPAQQAAIAVAMKKAGKKPKSVDEGIMDVVKQTFNDNVVGWPMGTSTEQFIQGWARDIKNRTGKNVPVEKLTQLYNNYVKRSGELMQSHGTTNEAETDYSKRRQRERDVDAGKPVAKQRQPKMTDYQKRRAQQKKEMELGEDQDTSGVESAIIRRIMVAHTDLLQQFGPEKVMQAAEEVAYNVGDVDEIGTSDVSAWVHEVKQILGA